MSAFALSWKPPTSGPAAGFPGLAVAAPRALAALPRLVRAIPRTFAAEPCVVRGVPRTFPALPRVVRGVPRTFLALPCVVRAVPRTFLAVPCVVRGVPRTFPALPRVVRAVPPLVFDRRGMVAENKCASHALWISGFRARAEFLKNKHRFGEAIWTITMADWQRLSLRDKPPLPGATPDPGFNQGDDGSGFFRTSAF